MSTKLDQLTSWLKERKITEVECLISDLTGIARGKISPTNKFLDEKGMRLPESVLLQTVTGDYVEDDIYYDLLDEADIDMFCRPDANAVFVVPWAIEPTAMVIHDTFDKQGNPIELSPRNILKKVLQMYAEKGWRTVGSRSCPHWAWCHRRYVHMGSGGARRIRLRHQEWRRRD